MNYSVEEVLNHNIKWVNAMLIEIARQDMENTLNQMGMMGADVNDITQARLNFEKKIQEKQEDKTIFKDDIRILEALGGTIEKRPRKK